MQSRFAGLNDEFEYFAIKHAVIDSLVSRRLASLCESFIMVTKSGASEGTKATAFGELVGLVVSDDGTRGGKEANMFVSVHLEDRV